jgi:hypothetical protein
VFPTPDTPGIILAAGEWVLVGDQWIVHNPVGNSQIVIRFAAAQLISLWSVDNEMQQENAKPAKAYLDNGIEVSLPWTGNMEIVPVPGGPWATQTITIRGASGDSPGIRWCQWQ